MFLRASSNLSFLPAITCASVCGGAAGVSRRCPLVTLVRGRRGGWARRGATTSMLGSAVVPLPAGSGVCARAELPRWPRMSAVALDAATIDFMDTDIFLIPIRLLPDSSQALRIRRKRLPSVYDGSIPRSRRSAAYAAIAGTSNDRCQESGGARGRNATDTEFRWTNSASVTRRKSFTACGSSSTGGVANNTAFANAITAQIAQESPGCWSESGLDAGSCCCADWIDGAACATIP